MYARWPFFRETLDLVAMTLSKADGEIARNYEEQLLGSGGADAKDAKDVAALQELGSDLRASLALTRERILAVTGCEDMSNGFRLLQRSMKTRYPYVDPLNVIQAELLKRLRKLNAISVPAEQCADKSVLEDTVIVSVNGISQGMKNSG